MVPLAPALTLRHSSPAAAYWRGPRALRWAAAAACLTGSALRAQPPHPPPTAPAVAPGTRVRLTLADPSVQFGGELFVRPKVPFEAQLVRLDSTAAVVRLSGRGQFSFPPATVRRLEARTGRGTCVRSARAWLACRAAGAVAGALVLPTVVGLFRGVPVEVRAIGAGLGAGLSLTVGRDSWASIPGWPPPR